MRLNKISGKDLDLVKAFFYEVGEYLNITRGLVSRKELEELIRKQKMILEMLNKNGLVTRNEVEELLIKKEELPEWRYKT